MELMIDFEAPDLDSDELLSRTIDLRDVLTREGGLEEVEKPEAAPEGFRGAEVVLGSLLMNLVSPELVTHAFDAIKSILVRDRSWSVKVTKPDGSGIEISGQNMSPEKLKEFQALLSAR